jgi:hypothetical protein
MRRLKNFSIAAAMGIMLAVGAPAAFAQQGSADDGYGEPAGLVQTQVGGGGGEQPGAETSAPNSESPAAATVQDNGGKLPFTGLDIALMVGAGGLLLLLGFGMRRLTKPTTGGIA